MPELPEVETVVVGLDKLIVGKKIKAIQVFNSPKSYQADKDTTEVFLLDQKIRKVWRRGKAILIDLENDYMLVCHLKMTGQLVFRGENSWGAGHPNGSLLGELPDNSTRVELEFFDSSKLFFNDQRKFGWLKLLPKAELNQIDFFQKLGPEPLEESTTNQILADRIIKRKRSNIKAVLLDQTTLAGVGNIYADESLWQTKIHPETKVENLSNEQLLELAQTVKNILQKSIDAGGSSSKNYVNASGKKGSYLEFANVYGRAGLECNRCKNQLIKIRVAGRGTTICEVCQ